MHPSVLPSEQERRENDHNDEEDNGHRGGISHFEILKGLEEQVERVEEGGIEWAALGHDEGLGEGLKRTDEAHDQVEENDGSEEREGDVPHPLDRKSVV